MGRPIDIPRHIDVTLAVWKRRASERANVDSITAKIRQPFSPTARAFAERHVPMDNSPEIYGQIFMSVDTSIRRALEKKRIRVDIVSFQK